MSFVSHLCCVSCKSQFPREDRMNLCPKDGRPVTMVLDLPRLRDTKGRSGWWNPSRRNLWRFGGLLPLDYDEPADRRWIVSQGEGHTPEVPYEHSIAKQHGFSLFVKDEGRQYPGYGCNPTGSFKDRGMAMTVSLSRLAGIDHLAVPTQGNAGDSLAFYAVSAALRASIVMSPDTDRLVLGSVAAQAALHPELVSLTLVPGTIVDCGRYVRERLVPAGAFSVATFQEPGWRIEGKKTLGLEMAEPKDPTQPDCGWKLPDVIVYPTGGGTGVLGMAKAFDELEALGLIGDRRPRMVCVQSAKTNPLVRAFEAGANDVTQLPAGETIATGLNVAFNVGHAHVLKIIRETEGVALSVEDSLIRNTVRDEWQRTRFGWSPEGAATLAALPVLVDKAVIKRGDRVVLVNTASLEKYLPTLRDELCGGI
jgi:threonine synthase